VPPADKQNDSGGRAALLGSQRHGS